MAIEISLKKGTANPTSGLTLAEPLFNSTNNTFWMGKGSANTPVWIGAGICGASGGIAAGLTYQIPTLGAVKDYFSAASSSFIGTTSPYISSFNGATGAIGFVGGRGITLSVSGATTTVNLNYLYGGTAIPAEKYPDKPDWIVFQSSSAPSSMYRTQLQNISYVLLGSLGTKGSGNFFRMASDIDGGAGTVTDEYVSFSTIANELIGTIDGGTFA